jgi:hypothetical protein
MAYFQIGDALNSDFSAQAEVDRFVFLDKQIYGMMSIFGNGVVEGWDVTQAADFSVSISPGYGNINFVACRTTFTETLENIDAYSITYLYVRRTVSSPSTGIPEFLTLPTQTTEDPNMLLLAQIVTDGNSITDIDNTFRTNIGFLEIIRSAIRRHRHRGGADNPTKIDLETEVQGQLPSFRIEPMDAEKVTSGLFGLARLPLIDHSDLANVGILTHPQLDTFVRTLEASNKELFGEIGLPDMMQTILSLKFIFDDPNSQHYMSTLFDENMVNQLVLIPGITPNSRIDFDATTAEIDLEGHEIRGLIPSIGTSFWVTYDSDLAWNSAYYKHDVTIANDAVTLSLDHSDETNRLTIENFEEAKQPGEDLSDGAPFKKVIVTQGDSAKISAEANATNVSQGFYAGRFRYLLDFRMGFIKEYSTAQDWSKYDSFVFKIKCLALEHGPVKLYFTSESGETGYEYVILDTNEVTEGDSEESNGFDTRVIDIQQIPFNDKIKSFTIYCDDTDTDFYFTIDDMYIQRAILLPDEGVIRLRYSTRQLVTFRSIEWKTIEPPATNVIVEARVANGTALLNRASFIELGDSGDIIDLRGTDIEIQVTLLPDADKVVAPTLTFLRIMVISDADVDGYRVSTVETFSRGTLDNLDLNTTPVYVSLRRPINVGSYFFNIDHSAQQVYQDTDANGALYTKGELAVFGQNTPIAPNLVLKQKEDNKQSILRMAKFFYPLSVRRLTNRSLLIADTFNDRILEMTEEGQLLNGFGSINYSHSSKTFPIATCFDTRSGIFYVVWSKSINFAQVNVSLITIQTSTRRVKLYAGYDKIMNLDTTELQRVNPSGQIMPIHLSSQNVGQVGLMTGEDTFAFFSNLVLPTGFDMDSEFYSAIFSAQGIPCYVGPFAYIQGIYTPTWADRIDETSIIVCNATIGVKPYTFPDGFKESVSFNGGVANIVIVDKNFVVKALPDTIKFSPFVPGRAEDIGGGLLIMGGLSKDSEIKTLPAELTFRVLGGTHEQRTTQRAVLAEMFADLKSDMVVYDRKSEASIFRYSAPEHMFISDVDLDPDGQYMVAESSFATKSGRVITVDNYGNIIFSYGEGLYSVIFDINVKSDGSVIIST